MTSDLRFHIASLAALFLALGIGIVIGTAFVGASVVERQTDFIRRLDVNVSELRRETQEAVKNEEALRLLLPGLVSGKLTGRSVLVVRTGDYPDAAEEAAAALRLAGAEVASVALPADAWRRAGATQEAITADAERLAPLLVSPPTPGALEAFRDDGRLSGDAAPGPTRLVVLVGGARSLPPSPGKASAEDAQALLRARDEALALTWQTAGVTVVGVEPMDAGISFVPGYAALGLATVDNIDRAAGQIALPFALLGEKAAYGMKATADRILPPSLARPAAAPAPPETQ